MNIVHNKVNKLYLHTMQHLQKQLNENLCGKHILTSLKKCFTNYAVEQCT